MIRYGKKLCYRSQAATGSVYYGMPFQIVQNDITDLPVAELVFATKPQQKAEGGVNREMYDATTNTKQEQPFVFNEKLEYGMVYATPAVRAPKRYIFHTAPPFFNGGFDGKHELLKACYLNCLNLALRLRCGSIAFPLLGSGRQGFSDTVAFRLASQWIQDFFRHKDLEIFLMLNDRITTIPNADINNQIEQYLARSLPDSRKSHQRENVARKKKER